MFLTIKFAYNIRAINPGLSLVPRLFYHAHEDEYSKRMETLFFSVVDKRTYTRTFENNILRRMSRPKKSELTCGH